MRTLTLRLFLNNVESPFEISINEFLFDYGIGKEKWGNNDSALQAAIKTFNPISIKLFQEYLAQLRPYLHSAKDIKEIEIQIDNDEMSNFYLYDYMNIEKTKIYKFSSYQFINFNAMYVNDSNPRFMLAFTIIPQQN